MSSATGNDQSAKNLGRSGRSLSDPTIGFFTLSNGLAPDVLDALLAAGITTPEVEILVQFPDTTNTLRQLSSLALDGITSFTLVRDEDMTANTLDFAVSNGDGRYLPSL